MILLTIDCSIYNGDSFFGIDQLASNSLHMTQPIIFWRQFLPEFLLQML